MTPDWSYALQELGRDVKGPTLESLAKLKHFLRYLSGNKLSQCFVVSDWAGCSKTRKSTSGSIVPVVDCDIIHSSRTQATVALSSGEAELYAIGQGINEALYVRNIIEFDRKVRIESTADKSMAIRFGSGKRTKHVELRYLYMQN